MPSIVPYLSLDYSLLDKEVLISCCLTSTRDKSELYGFREEITPSHRCYYLYDKLLIKYQYLIYILTLILPQGGISIRGSW